MDTMIERFTGIEGRGRLIETLRRQVIVHDNEQLATKLADAAELITLPADETLCEQGGSDNDIYFILAGRVSIVVNGREVAIRKETDHVGEMSLIDPCARRAASVIAVEPTVVAKVQEAAFSSLADENPRLWRLLAVVLSDRLRQRNSLITAPNPRPVLFIGSSKETLPIAQEIQSNLSHDDFLVRVWTDHVFGASQFPIEDLDRQLQSSDFAALVLGPDDKIVSRDKETDAPRDNVIFELGLFMGALSRQRTFIIQPRGVDIKIPTDLIGLTPLTYRDGSPDDRPALLAPICNDLRKIITKLGCR